MCFSLLDVLQAKLNIKKMKFKIHEKKTSFFKRIPFKNEL